MRVGKIAILWLGAISSLAINVSADEAARAPLANSFGRFWGLGYSAGYNARSESRFGLHRYVPEHNVVAPFATVHAHLMRTNLPACPQSSIIENHAPLQPTPSTTGDVPTTFPAAQPARGTPTGGWMRQLLKPDAGPAVDSQQTQPDANFQRDDIPSDVSPSDQRGVLLPFTKRYASPLLTVAPRLP